MQNSIPYRNITVDAYALDLPLSPVPLREERGEREPLDLDLPTLARGTPWGVGRGAVGQGFIVSDHKSSQRATTAAGPISREQAAISVEA
mmetsp:Transcript_39158/g.85926  ORF Transcript_39158/g.85926 Transcript_39158/m.85926 type:complete len:90 (-) Transcript_39158:155-424(-)